MLLQESGLSFAVKILSDLKELKEVDSLTLVVKKDLIEDETESDYRHGWRQRRYFFHKGKFLMEIYEEWNKAKFPGGGGMNGYQKPVEISSEHLLIEVSFSAYDCGFYGLNKPYVKEADTKNLIEKANAICNHVHLNIKVPYK